MANASRLDEMDERRTARFWKLYEKLFEKAPPEGWTVEWRVEGITIPREKRVCLSCFGMRAPLDLEVVVHEMLHVRDPKMPHGKEFELEVRRLMHKAKGKKK